MEKRTYYVDIKGRFEKKWSCIDGFTDVYEAIECAVGYSKKHNDTHKVRVWDSLYDKAILVLDV